MTDFIKISQANFKAFSISLRTADIISKKQEIYDSLNDYYNLRPEKILCIGFNSFVFVNLNAELFITAITAEMQQYLRNKNIAFKYIENIENLLYKFDVVIAADEFFTYAASDDEQKEKVKLICNLTSSYILTTLRDYKNQEYKDRECSLPMIIKNSEQQSLFIESHDYNNLDRNTFTSNLLEIVNNSQLENYGSFQRRTMYFKQLAKFSIDYGASQFLVHKNLMYKSLFKKNYEHVITIKI